MKQEKFTPRMLASLKSLGTPDEVREFPNGRLELVHFGRAVIGRAILEPGWRWSTCMKSIAETASCESSHFQYHVAGILKVKMEDGTELECHPGDVSFLPAGHDAWVVGNDSVIIVDFQGMVDFGKPEEI